MGFESRSANYDFVVVVMNVFEMNEKCEHFFDLSYVKNRITEIKADKKRFFTILKPENSVYFS